MKKILSLILALIMMLSCATMIFAEDTVLSDETPVEVDETASAYYEAVQFLVAYDIMHGKGETLGVYDDIQRYEMALFMARILTGWVEDSTWEDGTLNSSEFTDLAGTAADKYYGAISYVNQKGVIEGYGDGKFGPTDGITYQDALTMAVRALGYNGLAYPWGYIETAISLGLDDGITGVTFTDTLKREVVAQIIYNTLFATNKAGTTLAESVFDLSLAWTNIIITKTDAATGDVPAGYVAFSIFNDDGTIDGETYYVEAAQLGLDGVHDDEKAWGTVYKVMFDTEANYGLNTVIAYESLELETVANTGRLETVVGGYPIQAFLADFDIVTAYTVKNYLNTTPEIIIADGNGALSQFVAENYYAVDWATGNIVYVNKGEVQKLWYCTDGDTVDVFVPNMAIDGGSKDTQFGLYAQKGEGWVICDADGNTKCPGKKEGGCGGIYDYWQHSIASEADHSWMARVDAGTGYVGDVEQVLWYYHADLDAYFQITVDWKVVDGKPTAKYGMKYMTAAERAELEVLLNTYNYYTYENFNYLNYHEVDGATAYATLRVFDVTGDDVADYGLFEEYRFGVIYNTTIKCENCLGSGKHQNVAGYQIVDISNTPILNPELDGGASVALQVKAEGVCAHGTAWISDGSEVVDGSYVIYGYNPVTGEIKIVKTISATIEEDADNYIGYGYIRAYNVGNNTITIVDANGESFKVNYNYTALPGTISDAMLTAHWDEAGNVPNAGFPAIASRYLDGLFNQYVEYVMVDDRLAYLELEGASDNWIVVEKYAGIHEDGSIVVWGYEVGAKSNVTELKQFRINSFNGWAKGDWYNYSWLYEAEIEAAFERGALYQIMSYDPTAEGYNVSIIASAEDKDYFTKGSYTELTYADAKLGGMAIGQKSAGGTLSRKMSASDKYVFIYDIDDVAGYNAIPIVTYEGIVTNPAAYVKGYRIGNTDGQFIFYIDDAANVVGFAGAAEQGYGLVMFLEWGTNAAYDEYTGKNYLVGSTVRTAYVLDLYTSKTKEITVYPGNYVKAEIEGDNGSLKDGILDTESLGFYWFDEMTGCIYQTVNGVLVDDTPVDPALVPEIFAKTVTGTNIMTDALVLETGKVVAKMLNKNLSFDQSIENGYDNAEQGDQEGFAAIVINRRMTLKALGVAYHELAPYALSRADQKANVIINCIKANEDGTASILHLASQRGKQIQRAGYDRDMSLATNFFGDSGSVSQAYNYSMIYHSDINGSATAANKNSNSKAVVWLYDFEDAEELKDANVSVTESHVDGFVAPGYTYPETPKFSVRVNVAKKAWQSSRDAIRTADPADLNTALGADGYKKYYLAWGFEDGALEGHSNKTYTLKDTYLVMSEGNYFIENSDFTVSFWAKANGTSKGDPALISCCQYWESSSNPGFSVALNENGTLRAVLCDGADVKADADSDYALVIGEWTHIAVTYAKADKTIKLYVNGNLVEEHTDTEGTTNWGSGVPNAGVITEKDNKPWAGFLVVGQSASLNYDYQFNGVIDDLVVCKTVLTAEQIQAVGAYSVPAYVPAE